MKSILLSILLIGFSRGAYAARLDLDSHHANNGHHYAYGHFHNKHHEDFDGVMVKLSKPRWHPHHLFALIADKGDEGWHIRPFPKNDDDKHHGGGDPNAVPLPAAIWLFGSVLLGLAGLKRKRG